MHAQDSEWMQKYLNLKPDEDMTFNTLPEPQNVVCQGHVVAPIDRMRLVREFPTADYKEESYQAVTVRLRPPAGTTLLAFGTGILTAMGVSLPQNICLGLQMFRRDLIQLGHDEYGMMPISVENAVFSYSFKTKDGKPMRIHIDRVDYEDPLGFAYVPEVFPGLIYRMLHPAVTMLVFESGSTMTLGIRNYQDMRQALDHIRPILERHAYTPEELFELEGMADAANKAAAAAAAATTTTSKRGRKPGGAASGRPGRKGNKANTLASKLFNNNGGSGGVVGTASNGGGQNAVKEITEEMIERMKRALHKMRYETVCNRKEFEEKLRTRYDELLKRDEALKARAERKRQKSGAGASAAASVVAAAEEKSKKQKTDTAPSVRPEAELLLEIQDMPDPFAPLH